MHSFSFANFVTEFLIFLGKIVITFVNVGTLFLVMRMGAEDQKVTQFLAPCIVVAGLTFFTATVFLGLFDTAVMTLLLSHAVDKDMNYSKSKFGPASFVERCDDMEHKSGFHNHERMSCDSIKKLKIEPLIADENI